MRVDIIIIVERLIYTIHLEVWNFGILGMNGLLISIKKCFISYLEFSRVVSGRFRYVNVVIIYNYLFALGTCAFFCKNTSYGTFFYQNFVDFNYI